MEPGTPFRTKALDEQRSEQRRALRMVPEWLFEKYAPQRSVSDSFSSAGLLETELRREADRLRQGLGDLPERMEQETQAEVVIDFLRSSDVRARIGTGTAPTRLFSQRITELGDVLSGVAVHTEPERANAVALMSYVHVLVWADDVAGDGYSDPRLADRPSSGEIE